MSLKRKKPQSLSKCGTDIHSDFLMEPLRRIGAVPDPGNKKEAGAGALTRAARTPPLLSTFLHSSKARLDLPFLVFYPQDARLKGRFVLMGWLPPKVSSG